MKRRTFIQSVAAVPVLIGVDVGANAGDTVARCGVTITGAESLLCGAKESGGYLTFARPLIYETGEVVEIRRGAILGRTENLDADWIHYELLPEAMWSDEEITKAESEWGMVEWDRMKLMSTNDDGSYWVKEHGTKTWYLKNQPGH